MFMNNARGDSGSVSDLGPASSALLALALLVVRLGAILLRTSTSGGSVPFHKANISCGSWNISVSHRPRSGSRRKRAKRTGALGFSFTGAPRAKDASSLTDTPDRPSPPLSVYEEERQLLPLSPDEVPGDMVGVAPEPLLEAGCGRQLG